MMSADFKCSPYRSEDLQEILNLFSLSFGGRKLSDKYYLWRVFEHPLHKNFVDVFKNESGKLISHYAVCPAYSFFKGEYFNSALSLITMTHPEFNGMGLFPKLAANLYDRIHQDDDVQLVYGFPNTNSHYSFTNKLGWNDVYLVPTLVKIIEPGNSKSELVTADNIDARFDDLWKRVSASSQLFFANARNSAFLNWRFKSRPDKEYTILTLNSGTSLNGYVVVKEYVNNQDKEMDVVDFLSGNEVKPADLIEGLVTYARLSGYTRINLWAPYNSSIYAGCEKMGFLPKEPITYLGYRPFDPSNVFPELVRPGSWHITMCDSDVY